MSASISGRFISMVMSKSSKCDFFPTLTLCWILVNRPSLDLYLQNHRHDQRSFLRVLGNVALQVCANLLFDYAVIGALFLAGLAQGLDHNLPHFLHEPIFAPGEAARHDFRRNFNFPGELVDRDNWKHKTVFAEMA